MIIEHNYNARQLGVNGVTLPSATGNLTSNVIATDDCDIVKVYVFLDRTAATDVQFSVESYNVADDTWHFEETVAIVTGVATYSDYIATKAVTADKKYTVTLEVPGTQAIRLANIFGTSSTVDTIKISAVARQLVA
jgi:hypothetical protein